MILATRKKAILGLALIMLAMALPGSATTAATRASAGTAALTLASVSCARALDCVAVGGEATSSGRGLSLAEEWREQGWRRLPVPSPGNPDGLAGVSCARPSSCVAVGGYLATSGHRPFHTLAEAWNGTRWRLLTTPDPGPSSELLAVSCATPDRCMAIGRYGFVSGRTMAEAWNGTRWRVLTTPDPVPDSKLDAVSCATPDRCIAVGTYPGAAWADRALAEAWNGTRWRVLKIPNPARYTSLSGVSCVTPDRCIAVGSYQGTGTARPLAEAWNGTSWRLLQARAPSGAKGTSLSSISCPTAVRCIAVGTYSNASGRSLTMAEAWNGTSWRLLQTRNPAGNNDSFLNSISCPQAARCVAVGSYHLTSGPFSDLILTEAWNGTTWRLLP
jgi:hypothetical protein